MKPGRFAFLLVVALAVGPWMQTVHAASLVFACSASNDLYRVASENGMEVSRYDTPEAALAAARAGDGLLLLADGYPARTTALDAALFEQAARKKLRLFVEYPSFLPGVAVGTPRGTHWERAVVASDVFGAALARLRILAIHDCRFVPVKADHPHLVIGRVAGFDTAVYGLARQSFPILFELPRPAGAGEVLVATTKLSHFLTGRYAPNDAWQSIWQYVFAWLQPGPPPRPLTWTARVRPSFGAEETLPADIEQQALRRGIAWYFNSRMVVHPSMMAKYSRPANGPYPAAADPDPRQDWPYGHRIALMPGPETPPGDGSLGVMEGFDAKIFADGTQPARWWNRADCNAEIAGAMSAAGLVLSNPDYAKTGAHVGDWLFFKSRMTQGHRADPQHPAFGLIGWNDSPQYCGPGSMDGFAVYYGDDNARSMLGMMLAAAALKTERYDERLLQALLANLRLSGRLGFQPDRLDQGPLEKAGWEHFFRSRHTSLSPHYQASLWACYLWAYRHTGFELFLQRARTAIGLTMAAYPDRWVWTNGLQQERAKMLLALAWLVRAQDTPEHRAWLRRIAEDLVASQDPCGAIREVIGQAGKGGCPPPASNEAYGTAEAPLIQSNADAASDLLYTCNFALLALHEAAAATGEAFYRTAEDKLATFLCRIQIRSESHPELDGGWFRAFDFKRWEYWASSTDAGWGAWSIESGWTQSWITSVLALRHMQSSLWDITAGTRIRRHFATLRPRMIPDDILAGRFGEKVRHAAVGKAVTLRSKVSDTYPGEGAASLTDGLVGKANHLEGTWLGFQGENLVALIDLGEPVDLRELSGSFLQDIPLGIFLPQRLEFRAGNDPAALPSVGTATPVATARQPGPLKEVLTIPNLNLRARYLEVRAISVGSIPSPHRAAGAKAWLFVEEILVNREPARLSLSLIPPSPVSEQVTVDIRAAVWHDGDATNPVAVAFYLDAEEPAQRLHEATLDVPPKAPAGVRFRWPAKGQAGSHRILLVARARGQTWRCQRPLEVRKSDARSLRRLGGAWVDLYHHDPAEGKPFDAELGRMTDAQWRELVRAMHAVEQKVLVITMMFQNFTHRGRHQIETEGYAGKAYYPSRLFPGRMPIAARDPLEAILSEADTLEMQVMPGVGMYAFFDYTPGSLRWHQQVAAELWERYGHHPSFYGWYVSGEKDGGLGNAEERREIVEFFKAFTPYLRRLAPDKPVMLAPNCFHLRGAEATYRQLLPHLDILCPFGFHRMPAGDLRGEEAAARMQSLCDEAGCHLWMDLESFVFRHGVELHPRPIQGLISDFTRFPHFEKTLHYQFPGLMCAPWMSRRPGGDPAVELYRDYERFLKGGVEASREKP